MAQLRRIVVATLGVLLLTTQCRAQAQVPVFGTHCIVEAGTFKVCYGHGKCGAAGCECYDDYFGPGCDKRICPQGKAWADVPTGHREAHAVAECSNMGICDHTTGRCKCELGFGGTACERLECPDNCKGNGACMSLRDFSTLYEMEYTDMWDVESIWGCMCDSGFAGYDCSLRVCPLGDDPMTKGQLDEVQLLKCDLGNEESSKEHFYVGWKPHGAHTWQYSTPINWDDSEETVNGKLNSMSMLGEVQVKFLTDHLTACAGMGEGAEGTVAEPQIIQVTFLTDFGDLEPLRIRTDGSNAPLVTVACKTGSVHFPCSSETFVYGSSTYQSVMGTKENLPCSNRGSCDEEEGVCLCQVGNGDYRSSNGHGEAGIRGDCGFEFENPYSCDYTGLMMDCSSHGVCSTTVGTYEQGVTFCLCADGWSGYYCDTQICPYGKAWFGKPRPDEGRDGVTVTHGLAECSNRGVCEKTNGVCVCQAGFTGVACQRLACPAGLVSMGTPEGTLCSGHGDCLSLSMLAEKFGTEYEIEPHDPYVWDHDQIYGCSCNEGYGGHDCGKRLCPLGHKRPFPGLGLEEQVLGDEDLEECSGNGYCDYLTGSCVCYHGFTASDGDGNHGTKPDCGFMVENQFRVAAA